VCTGWTPYVGRVTANGAWSDLGRTLISISQNVPIILVLASQLPPEIVNLLLTIPNKNIKLTILRGIRLSKTNEQVHCVK